MQLRLLSAADLRTVMDMSGAVDAVARAFALLSQGRARAPLRTALEVEDGTVLVMPGHVPGREPPSAGPGATAEGGAPAAGRRGPPPRPDEDGDGRGPAGGLGAKVVSVFPGNPARALPVVSGVVLVVDPGTGMPRGVLEAAGLTALRTGAASGVATRYLARPDAVTLAVFGAGVQARTQIEAVRAVRPIREVRVVSRSGRSAEALAEELAGGQGGAGAPGGSGAGLVARAVREPAAALAGADVVVAATDSPVPVFPGAEVEPGTHVNGVGSYTVGMREVDATLVARATVVVDDREAAWAEAGDLVGAVRDGAVGRDHVRAELGEVVRGVHPGRTASDEITFFKSVGNAVQDMAVAGEALRRAEERGVGTVVEL